MDVSIGPKSMVLELDTFGSKMAIFDLPREKKIASFKNGNFCLKLIFKRQDIKEFLGKCPDFRKNMSFCRTYLSFNYVFFPDFFDSNYLDELFGSPIGPFFDFLPYMAENCIFV